MNRKSIIVFFVLFMAQVIMLKASQVDYVNISYPEHYGSYTVSDWNWISTKLNADQILNTNNGHRMLANLWGEPYDLLCVVSKMNIEDNSQRSAIIKHLISFLDSFLSHRKVVALLESEERKKIEKEIERREKHMGPGGYRFDAVIFFPIYIFRSIIMLEPTKEQLDQCWGILDKVPDKELSVKYKVAFIRCIICLSKSNDATEYITLFKQYASTEDLKKEMVCMQYGNIIKTAGLQKYVHTIADEYLGKDIKAQQECDDFLQERISVFNYYVPFRFSFEEVKGLFTEAKNEMEKLIIINMSLSNIAHDSKVISEFEPFLNNCKFKTEASGKERFLYNTTVELVKSIKNYRSIKKK